MSGVKVYEPSTGQVIETVDNGAGEQRQVVAAHVLTADGNEVSHGNAWEVTDYYTNLETLADQSGSGSVLTFTFTSTPKLIVIFSSGGVSRAQVGTGTPSATNGVVCDNGVPSYVPVQNKTVKVYAPVGAAVSVWGLS